MERNKRWHISLIVVVLLLTLYNILPTLFFYSKPLSQKVDQKEAMQIASMATNRVDRLEKESKEWIQSFANLLKVKVKAISINPDAPQEIKVDLSTDRDAAIFKKYLPNAGQVIPFFPAQLSLAQAGDDLDSKSVIIQRKIPVHFGKTSDGFEYTTLTDESSQIAPLYKELTDDRLLELTEVMAGVSDNAQLVALATQEAEGPRRDEYLTMLSGNILSYVKALGETSPVTKRFFASFTQGNFANKSKTIAALTENMEKLKERIKFEKVKLLDEEKSLQKNGQFLESTKRQQLDLLEERESDLLKSVALLKKHSKVFAGGEDPLNAAQAKQIIAKSTANPNPSQAQAIQLGEFNPLVDSMIVDWGNSKLTLKLHNDVEALRNKKQTRSQKEQLDQLIFNEIARVSREANEDITPYKENFEIALHSLADTQSLLVMDLKSIAAKESDNVSNYLNSRWNPQFKELSRDTFPIVNAEQYQKLSSIEKKYCLLVTSPLLENNKTFGFRNSSVYVVAKGLGQMINKYNQDPSSEASQKFFSELKDLQVQLRDLGFTGYPGTTYPLPSSYANDYIFEAENYYQPILQATREDFKVHGTKRFATLEFSNVKQRVLTLNKIENAEQEELLKWRDEYAASQLDHARMAKFEIPKPTKSPLWSNLALSARKYFRGDDRKILNWGLDLMGGKTVSVELRDNKGAVVSNENDINQGINELYNRVNKMGVSEVAIRQEGSNITLDFPGSQGLSAKELIKASSMSFHMVNEKFSTRNAGLRDATSRFLQEVWNEAVVTNRKDIESINRIAWNHLYGDPMDAESASPRSEAARLLFKNGLRLANPDDKSLSSAFDDSVSTLAMYRGDNFSDWYYQTNPLLVVFNNYALEGSDLVNIHSGFDPSEGNFLSFEVKGAYTNRSGERINPRDELYGWTSMFAKDKLGGTVHEKATGGEGWRMAVILNDQVISAPALSQALKSNGRITGSFTQRDIGRLEADLKAGSLTFTPHILSEKNVSPELGLKERKSGIVATIIALALVIVVMCVYYRFAGVIASVAVLLNLLIMWATLQNIQATITLATIAGIILTMGMAVDANVLIFERIREEFKQSGRVGLAISVGYKKAFTAIVDSNVTTVIAALILLNFDSGPIKGFAVSLIIGILTSMFTALFLTRSFFRTWAKNPNRGELKMMSLIRSTNFNFLKFAKPAFVVVALIALVGGASLAMKRHTIFGMDFTGGYALTLEVEPNQNGNYRSSVEAALEKNGLTGSEFEVRELSPSNQLRIFLAKSLEQPGNAFASLTYDKDRQDVEYAYETNPRIDWVVNALKSQGVELTETSKLSLDSNWTSVSGQMSDSMRNNALIGLGIALICILLYITFRFEFTFAISATLGLAVDCIVTLGLLGILHFIGVPVQIDLNTIAALMTIIGYSLNDTIIVFDRIREDLKYMRKATLGEVINHSLNVTLSRTTMTSLTTLVVLIALIAFGGQTIFGFSLVMAMGVVIGTFSTLFIATALLLLFQKKESSNRSKAVLSMQ